MYLLQNTIAQGTSLGLPHNSPLTKLAMRPKNNPIGATTAIMSATGKSCSLFCRQNSQTATATPANPPWKDIPPSQIVIRCIG